MDMTKEALILLGFDHVLPEISGQNWWSIFIAGLKGMWLVS